MILHSRSPQELAKEALEALRTAPRRSSREHFAGLVHMGLIDTLSLLTTIFGRDAAPEIEKAEALLHGNANGEGERTAGPGPCA